MFGKLVVRSYSRKAGHCSLETKKALSIATPQKTFLTTILIFFEGQCLIIGHLKDMKNGLVVMAIFERSNNIL